MASTDSTIAPPDKTSSDARRTDAVAKDASKDAVDRPSRTTFGGSRPTTLLVPADYDPSNAYPLIITLHGYGQTGQFHLDYIGYAELVDSAGILVTAPNGSNFLGTSGWNSIPEMSTPDDAAYLRELIVEIKGEYNVDPERVFISGHSAGGFMANRMACEHADQVRGILALSASSFYDDNECSPTRPVSVLHIHGSIDAAVSYHGGQVVALNPWTEYPSVDTTIERWAARNACQTGVVEQGALDLDTMISGKETARIRFDCPAGVDVELWRIRDGAHIPQIDAAQFSTAIVDWLLASKK